MKILFCGGGTLGPVTPLIAVLRRMQAMRKGMDCSWIGTAQGPERALVEREGIPFHVLPDAKFPRYPSPRWLTFPVDYARAGKAARNIVAYEAPKLVVSAGGYVGVPMIKAAAKQGIACAIHQLDAEPGLSNRAVAGLCRSVTTSFAYPSPPFGPGVESTRVATPCRFAGVKLPSRSEAADRLGVDATRKIVFVFGGGTGALAINRAVEAVLEELTHEHAVIHSAGKGKSQRTTRRGYHHFELMDERQMLDAYAVADLVVARAGMGTLSELAALSKAAIIVPMPDTHQEANAKMLEEGIEIIGQHGDDFPERLKHAIRHLLHDAKRRSELGARLHGLLPTDDGTELAERWLELV